MREQPQIVAIPAKVVLELKTPWRGGTTHLVMSPLVFLQRLAALVPRPPPRAPAQPVRHHAS